MLQKLIKEELFGLAGPEDFGVHNGIDTQGSRQQTQQLEQEARI